MNSDITCRCESVVQCNSFWTFVSAVGENSFPFNSLPASAKRHLYKAIVYCGSCMKERKQDYWDKVSNIM